MLRRLGLSESSTRQTLREMAQLSLLTDKISEVQVKNLKMYPFIFFEAVKQVSIRYDLSNDLGVDFAKEKEPEPEYRFQAPETKHLIVSYYLDLDERLNGSLPKRFQAIEDSVRTIFWKQVKVEVYFNNKKVYESADVRK